MADVCLTAPAVLSPISPNERRKRRHGYDSHVSEGCGANWYKRHRTGHSFARRLLHLRGFSLNVQQADELVRFIDQFPPEMDKDVSSILEKCGDIDDAIRQLTSLKLTAERKAARDDVATATNDAGETETQKEKVLDVEAAERKAAEADAASSAAANLAAAAPAVLSKDWVRAFVQEMQSSADVDDAHARATRVMQAFEAAVRGAVVAEEDVADGVAMQNGSEGRKRRMARLAEENLILKRAVAIQNARQQESGELQRQILELQRACAGYQEQLQQAQRQNYSLGVHLKEALSPQVPSHNNRDVF